MAFGVLSTAAATALIFGSSRVYGDIRHVTDEPGGFRGGRKPYSSSKIAGEAFIYSYAQCYKLPHLVFRFSNVYSRYDCDLERLERVIPLFIRRVTGRTDRGVRAKKVLDFTYIDDCVNGVVRAIDLLVAGKVAETINLAYGQGDASGLVNMWAGLQKQPKVHYEPSRLG